MREILTEHGKAALYGIIATICIILLLSSLPLVNYIENNALHYSVGMYTEQ